jgi:hypothetical protein
MQEDTDRLAKSRGVDTPGYVFDIVTEPAVHEMTLDEIEEKLGYKVKIVNKENGKWQRYFVIFAVDLSRHIKMCLSSRSNGFAGHCMAMFAGKDWPFTMLAGENCVSKSQRRRLHMSLRRTTNEMLLS